MQLETNVSTAAAPTVDVEQGNHQIQAAVNVNDHLTITSAENTSLEFHNVVDLGTNNLVINPATGGTGGAVNLNNTVSATGGTITNHATLGTGSATSLGGNLVSTGTLDIDITPNTTDLFIVSGTATLSGTLNVDLQDGFTPTQDIIVLMAAGGITNNGIALGGPDAGQFGSLLVQNNNLVLSLTTPEDADFDENGLVGGRDLLAWQQNFSTIGATHAQGDANFDGKVLAVDGAIWRSQYGGSSALANNAVAATIPEPSAMTLLIFALALATRSQ